MLLAIFHRYKFFDFVCYYMISYQIIIWVPGYLVLVIDSELVFLHIKCNGDNLQIAS